MGCCGGSMPPPEQFLVAQNKDPAEPLFPDCPASDSMLKLTVDDWPGLNPANVKWDGEEGEPKIGRKVLNVKNGGTVVAKLDMPPPGAFKKFTNILNANNEIVGAMYTGQNDRPTDGRLTTTKYKIMSVKPRQQGQQPMMQTADGKPLYEWCTNSMPKTSFTVTGDVTNGPQYKINWKMGYWNTQPKSLITNAQGGGASMSQRMPDSTNVITHSIAAGMDPGLAVCLTWAVVMAKDEEMVVGEDNPMSRAMNDAGMGDD